MEVLLVAFHYPPEISGGIPRALITERWFVQNGCRVRVLTPQPAERGCRGGEILHVPLPGVLATPPVDDDGSPRTRSNPLRAFARKFVFTPDGFVLWARRALRRALESAAERPIDLVVTSSPPESMHGIGRALSRRLGCRWLADFRDGWTFEPHRPDANLPVRRHVERWMEARVVRSADIVATATRPIADDLRTRYPARADSIHFLPSGFEPFEGVATVPTDRFELVYTGRMNLSRGTDTPAVFFQGLERAVAQDPAFARATRLTLIGQYTHAERALWQNSPLVESVAELGPMPYDEAVARSASATMLVLLTPSGQKSIATRKLFDYLAVRRPIFALAEGNEAARILTETRAGTCVPPTDPDAVAAALLHAFALWRDGKLDAHIPCDRSQAYEATYLFDVTLRERLIGFERGAASS
ncbi:MAG: glycosyltransferase [Planctomycetes bacterium]|nr:glycosyltransferase [Planctomycetota bacterium]